MVIFKRRDDKGTWQSDRDPPKEKPTGQRPAGRLRRQQWASQNRGHIEGHWNIPTTGHCWIMGNHTGKNSNGPTASPLDFFHTPPTTPLEADLTAMALSSAASSNKAQTPSPPSSTTPSTTSPIADYAQKLSAPSEWAVISVDSVTSTETNVSDAAARYGKAVVSLGSPASQPSFTTPSEQTWQGRDCRLEPQTAAERAGEEMTLALLGLMEDYRASLGLSPNIDVTSGPVDLLRHLMVERDELAEEVDTLKETLRTERLEWHQFQCDLQVAVSVADRLRAESEEALGLLQESHRAVEERLSQALNRQQVTEKELESLRAEHSDICRRLTEFTLQQQQVEPDTLENTSRVKDREACDTQPEGQGEEIQDVFRETEESESKNVEKENETGETQNTGHGPENEIGSGLMHLTEKRVAEGYICSLASLGKKKEGRGQRDPRKIVMLSERSWSLSRLPLPNDTSSQSGALIDTSTTLPLCKKEEPTKGRKMDRILQRQDSWSSFYTVKQDEDQSTESIKPQDGFSALLRRHGGSRRNSLLRWCQSRTQGYKNIEITNFSSSWEDGLAFCAVYHTYLPTYIPYGSLNPADKKENLALAFKAGENVGISATLTVEDMLKADGPDWQRVLAYVESIFRHFEM